MDWQPIVTAPKDEGTYILGRVGKIGILPCVWDSEEQGWVTWNAFFERQFKKPFEPTHWMPISPPSSS